MKNNILTILAVVFLAILVVSFQLVLNTRTETPIEIKDIENYIEDEKQFSSTDDMQDSSLIVLKIAHNYPISHPQHIALTERFVPKVEKGSNWHIRIEVYPNNQLVAEKQYIEGVRQGTIEMCIAGQSLIDILPKTKILQFPYIFDSYDEANMLLNGVFGMKLTQGLETTGIRSLAWSSNGFRQIFLCEDSINNIIKLATLSTQVNIDTLNTMGYDALPLDLESMTLTLKQKSVEGHDNPLLLSYYSDWYENHKKIIITNHIIEPSLYMISTKFWNRLPDEYKTLIKNSAKETVDYEIELLKRHEQEILNALKAKGVTIENIDLTLYKKAVSPLYEKWIKGDSDLENIFELLKKINSI